MNPRPDFVELAASLDRNPALHGRLVAEVPDLAALRYRFRRGFYRWADVHFFLVLFNFTIAVSPLSWLWPLNAFAAGLSVTMMFFSERRAREMSRQLHRPAAEQVARDLLGIRG